MYMPLCHLCISSQTPIHTTHKRSTTSGVMSAPRVRATLSKVTVQHSAANPALTTAFLTDDLHVKIAASNDIALCALLLMATNKEPMDWEQWAPIRFTFTWIHAVLTNLLEHDKLLLEKKVDDTRALTPDQQRIIGTWLASPEAMKALEIEARTAATLARRKELERPAPAPAPASAP